VRGVPAGPQVEFGAGGGFLKALAPQVKTSEFLAVRGVNVRASAEAMPFADASLAAVYMLDVLHHLPHPRDYFAELTRCLKPGGRALMIEPFLSTWSRFVYSRLHHEPVEPGAPWELASSGPLSSANTALPWIIFERDAAEFRET
jgi:SAM-dependent methyltransferase